MYLGSENAKLNLEKLLLESAADTIHYLCGPPRMLSDARSIAKEIGIAPDKLIFETFEE